MHPTSVRVPLQPFSLMLFPVWHLSIVIDRRASSDWSPGLMLVWARPGLSYVLSLYVFITSWVCVMHDVCIMLGSSLVFLAFFYYMLIGRKKRVYHIYFITTHPFKHVRLQELRGVVHVCLVIKAW